MRTLGTLAQITRLAEPLERRPVHAAVLAGIVGALLATYPLVLGGSVVSPAIGPVHMLYDQPPYSFGYEAPAIENARWSDVGSMMWAIIPYTAVQREALAAREAPLWNRYNSIGEPLWGQGQTFMLDPFHVASLAIPDVALAMDLRFIVARMVFAVGTGVMVVSASGSWLAACVMAFVAPFVGHFTARFNHPAYFSIIYAPWILVAYQRLACATQRRRWTAAAWLAGATYLQMVGSTPKEGLFALLAAHVAGLLGLLFARDSWSDRLGRIDAALMGAICGLLLSAPHWLIFLDTLSRSWTLSDQPRAVFASNQEAIAFVIGPVIPGATRTGIHVPALLAALLALACPAQLLRSGAGLGALTAVGGFASVAVGAIPADLLVRLPLIGGVVHVGNTLLAATIAPLLLASGLGLTWARASAASQPVRIRMAVALGAAAVAIVLLRTQTGHALWFALLVLLAGVCFLWATCFGRHLTATRGLAVGLCAYLSVAAGGLHVPTGVEPLDEILIQPRARANLEDASPAIVAIQAQGRAEPSRVAPIEQVLFPGTQALWGLEGIGGPDALRLPGLDSVSDLGLVERTSWMWLTVLHATTLDAVRGFLDMVNVKYLVTRRDRIPPGLRALPQEGEDLLRVFERPTAWPRAFFVDGVERHENITALGERVRAATGPFASVGPLDREAVGVLPVSATHVVAAESYRLTPNTTTFSVRSTGPGLAVLSEAFVEHDFEATLNGQASPYLLVNHAFKGVVIPTAGTWTVSFSYRPRFWWLSWGVAGVGSVLLTALAMASRLPN